MKKMNSVVMATLALLTVFVFASCSKSNDDITNDNNKGKALVHIMLTDAPAQMEAVNIDIQEVQLHNETDGWITVPMQRAGIYNLLQFSNGLDTLLGVVEMPAGTLSQVRLILGSENTVMVNGESFPLTVPSGSTSGLKLNVHQELVGGQTYVFWLDFDAAQSVHQTGNGRYMLKPVIRMFAEPSSGAIEGYVLPHEAQALVTIYNSSDTLMAIPDPLGYFKVRGIPAGTYNVDFASQTNTTPYITQTIVDVQVVNGETVQLDPITLILP